ncbi:MAG TPA: hypothetical protein VF824_19615 [Thermoanaerobaculia bacterium]
MTTTIANSACSATIGSSTSPCSRSTRRAVATDSGQYVAMTKAITTSGRIARGARRRTTATTSKITAAMRNSGESQSYSASAAKPRCPGSGGSGSVQYAESNPNRHTSTAAVSSAATAIAVPARTRVMGACTITCR